jgi:ABC-type Fe3+-hydroxamate transport system substrate-binding protein
MVRRFIDQMKREVEVHVPPKRIISLVPSQTELLCDLGLEKEVVGITRFCIHPKEWFASKTRIGGTKKVNIDKVKQLQPDLIIANKEENTREDIEALEQIAPVWISDVNSLHEAKHMIERVGLITGKEAAAEILLKEISDSFEGIQKANQTVLYFIWKDPHYVAGKNTFIDAMLTEGGYINVCPLERYPSLNELGKLDPDLVFLSTEPYPFNDENVREFQSLFPNSKILLVDGEMFSWYGSRLTKTPSYFNELLKELSR